ncbi:flavoprotein [Halobacteriovorax marinus]|uniref:Flavoprotein n=1 Tax=Halobacteriovorax marinus TaxID=97084 RepID=A0A1Y5FBB0_9BACT|nr:flavoprotein [Halobacteriovorax marinus]
MKRIKSKREIVIVVGAGPVGIAAAANLVERGLTPIVLERGLNAGHAMEKWGHIKLFTPWKFLVDKSVLKLLAKTSWKHPEREHLPTGKEIVDEYLKPAALDTQLSEHIIYDAKVISISKKNLSKSSSLNRDEAEYSVKFRDSHGVIHTSYAAAVIDATGTWFSPNPIGVDGLPVAGEIENSDLIHYGIPDASGRDQESFLGKRTLVLGGGHSAINITLDILKLRETSSDTKLIWGLRKNNIDKLLGGGINDKLPARGALGMAAKKAIDEGDLELFAPFVIEKLVRVENTLEVHAVVDSLKRVFTVDNIVVTTGFRPNLEMLRELRLDVDHIVEAPTKLAPLIDPNLHSCGSVRPHGVNELTHYDKNFFIVGMKAYGRAPTFLMLTGYEQVRSITAFLAGDFESANTVELTLPSTGVCSTKKVKKETSSCCAPKASSPGCC